jgi:hypothetical protein
MNNNEKRLLLLIVDRFSKKGTHEDLVEARKYLCEVAFSSPLSDPVHDRLIEIETEIKRSHQRPANPRLHLVSRVTQKTPDPA